jgi:UDP-glucose:(heptosyl)LPS alpha-1,3-glucosyltransferase
MRFAFCIFKYFPYGGIQRDLMKFAHECASRGHTIKIFCLRWEAPPAPELDVEVVPIEGFTRHAQYDHFAKIVAERLRVEPFDLVVGFNKMPGLDVYYAGDSCFVEKANTQRSGLYRLSPRYRSFYGAEKAVYDKTSLTEILTLSDVELPLYRHHYRTDPSRFHALPPGIEKDRIAPADKAEIRRDLREEFGFGEDEHLVLFVGSGYIKKGLDRALLAMKSLPDEVLANTRLLVVGRDKPDAFARMAMRLGLKDRVTFFSEGRDDLPRFLFAADSLIHPAYDEAAGMVIIESMLAGLPALVTKNCGYAHYLSSQNAGIVLPNPFSQAALDEAFVRLLTSADERRVWAQNGLRARERDELFGMVTAAVDHLERFAERKKDLLVFVLFRYFPYGGMQRDFMRIALACQARGHRILVYCLSWQGDIPDGFEVITFETSALSNHARSRRFVEHVREDLEWRRPALVVGFNKMPGLDVYYAADSCYEHKAQQMRTPLYRKTRRYRRLAAFEQAVFAADADTKVMLVARNQKDQYQQYYDIDDSRFFLLPPGVVESRKRSDAWQKERCRIRREFGLGEEERLLVTIGSGFVTKGVDRVLHAFAAVCAASIPAKLLIIGQSNAGPFQRLAKQLGVAERVVFVRGRDDIPAVLQGADLMLHPAYMESGGMVLIESVIAGLPVVATAVCGFSHYIEDADAGVVVPEPFDQGDFNAVVIDALRDPDRRVRWSANGVEFGREHDELYDMPRHAVEFIEECMHDLRP